MVTRGGTAQAAEEGIYVEPKRRLGTLLRTLLQFARRKPLGAIGGLMLLLLVLVAVFAPVMAPYDPLRQDVPNRLQMPSRLHLMGTDDFGRDVFSRVVFGAQVSLYVGLLSVGLSTIIGTLIGLVSGYFGGKLDMVLQRAVDTVMGFPALILALMLMAALGASLNNVVIAITVVLIPRVARIARSSAMSVRKEDYVTAAIAIGASSPRLLFRHVLPNTLAPIITIAAAYLGYAIVTEATLSFLGLGVPPPHPSWGQMLQGAARRYTEAAPWLVIFPGVALSLAVFGFNLFGDALRDVLDPRLRGA